MSIYRYAGKLLRTASGALAVACCCLQRWCVPTQMQCDMLWWQCLSDPQTHPDKTGPHFAANCGGACPEPVADCCLEDVNCPSGYECIEGECWPPVPHYCCYDTLDPYTDQPNGTTFCQQGPCVDAAHTASGPHRTAQDCADKCRKYSCASSPCDGCPPQFGKSAQCTPDPNGAHLTYERCVQDCTQCSTDCTLVPCVQANGQRYWVRTRGGNQCGNLSNDTQQFPGMFPPYIRTGGQTVWPFAQFGNSYVDYWFETDGLPNRPICVTYASLNGRPIRVQIRGPQMNDCNEVAEVIKRDSGWRGIAACDCKPTRVDLPLNGAPAGVVRWGTQQRHSTWFKVRVFAPCPDSSWKIAVNCNECHDLTEEPCCACTACTISESRIQDDRTGEPGNPNAETHGYFQEAIRGDVGPWSITWKPGYPAALKCTYFWWKNDVQCFRRCAGCWPGDAVGVRYWRLYTCRDGVLVNRTDEAVVSAEPVNAPGTGQPVLAVTNTVGGPAIKSGPNAFGAPWGPDPTGSSSCPVAVDQKPLLDPIIVCP